MELNAIYNEDCLEGMKKLNDDSVDLTVTSPPYDNLRTYNGNNELWNEKTWKMVLKELYRITKNGGVVVWVVGDAMINGSKSLTSYEQAIYAKGLGFKIYDVIIYEKTGTNPPHKNRYFNAYEYMFVFSKGKPKTVNLISDKPNKWAGTNTGKITRREKDGTLTSKGSKKIKEFGTRTNIWKIANGRGQASKDLDAHEHPAIFPEKLAQDHISTWSDEGDVVLDVFMGSGTTAIAAINTNRKYIGFELDKTYFELANKRIEGHKVSQ